MAHGGGGGAVRAQVTSVSSHIVLIALTCPHVTRSLWFDLPLVLYLEETIGDCVG